LASPTHFGGQLTGSLWVKLRYYEARIGPAVKVRKPTIQGEMKR